MGKCVFFMGWMQKEEYKNWIAVDQTSKSKARCRICNKSIDVASMPARVFSSVFWVCVCVCAKLIKF